jgi:hypothetical protein
METTMSPLSLHFAPTARALTRIARHFVPASVGRAVLDRHVDEGRALDLDRPLLPDALSRLHTLPFLTVAEHRFLGQVQGRSYARFVALAVRFIRGKRFDLGVDHGGSGDPTGATARAVVEERRQLDVLGRLEDMLDAGMPRGYRFVPNTGDVTCAVLGRSDWAVLALTVDIEHMWQANHRTGAACATPLDPLWQDVTRDISAAAAAHAVLDESRWRRADALLTAAERDDAITDWLDLVRAIDEILRVQAQADTAYFLIQSKRSIAAGHQRAIAETLLTAYRWQHIVAGLLEPRFVATLKSLVAPVQMARIEAALAPVLAAAVARGPG